MGCSGKRNFGYPKYSEQINEFIDDVYKSELMVTDYHRQLEGLDQNYERIIPEANVEQLKAVLTYYVRGERLCDGMWESACKEKVFLKILYRLKELEKLT
ncbi:DUF6508 domain-containing protein [Aquibacillus koreensis]|uniref:DUF6508 domain-containing protein n=1 Tax=Aquibacillus koreensis TaxID=279446 RepID=A0A9X3WJZ8_9BACI|nr:DUF6508 domain-containing protein [Aquibacillus koreensis]MCT2535828.1 DUF6508 domain-containing protein [Aquibacillus koreensis]MDC3420283.1 DUF6508 domain-containing protein [Aquibacillus koreensis]